MLACVLEWFGPPKSWGVVRRKCFDDKGVMKMGKRGGVPGATDQGTREEVPLVIDKIGDYHFDNFQGKSCGGRQACCESLGESAP